MGHEMADLQLENEKIIYLGVLDWNFIRQRPHHLAMGLAEHNDVLFVEMAVPSILGEVGRRLRGRRRRPWLPRLERVAQRLWVYTPPPVLPFGVSFESVNRLNQHFLSLLLRPVLGKLGFESPILWLGHPLAAKLIGHWGEKLVCYDCMDNYPKFYPLGSRQRRLLEKLESQVFQEADVVFASSKGLWHKCRNHHENVRLILNAAAIQDFARARNAPPVEPPEIAALQRPILGYIGTVDFWLDLELLQYVAEANPSWSVVVIGPLLCSVQKYWEIPNLHFLGKRDYQRLPDYLYYFDVCLIPFRVNDLTRNVNPVKLYEYLAAGKKVVATEMPELEPFHSVCRVSSTKEQFVANIRGVLREIECEGRHIFIKSIQVVEQHSWEARIKAVSEALRARLASRAAKYR